MTRRPLIFTGSLLAVCFNVPAQILSVIVKSRADRPFSAPLKAALSASRACTPISNADAGLSGPPMRAPSGSIPVSPRSIQAAVDAHGPNTSFLLKPGTYTDATVTAKSGDAFYGQGQATWNGEGQSAAFNFNGSNILVSGIAFTGFSPANNGGNGIFYAYRGSNDITIEGNTIAYNQGMPIQINTNRWKVSNNCIHDNGSDGIASYQSLDTIISHNEVYNNATSLIVQNLPATQAYAAGIKFFMTSNAHIERNYVHSNAGVGIWLDTDNTGTVIEGNNIINNHDAGVMEEISYGAVISYNTIASNGFSSTGWIAGAGIFVSTSSNVLVFSNTLTDNADGVLIYEDPSRGSGLQGPYKASNINIHTNYIKLGPGITDPAGGSTGFTSITGGAQSDGTNKFIDNHYCLGSGDMFQVGNTNTDQLGWQAAGYDTTGTFDCGF